MLSKIVSTTLAALLAITLAAPAHAGLPINGVSLNGFSLNGLTMNGQKLNGAAPDSGSFVIEGLELPPARN